MSLASTLTVNVAATLANTLDLATLKVPLLKKYEAVLTDGSGAGQANKLFADTRTLAASANEDLDLAGVLTDPAGASLTFTKVKGLLVAAAAGNQNNVVVGGAASNGFVSWVGAADDKVVVRPGGVLALFAGAADATGYAVTAGTADLLRIANSGSGSSVTYDIIVVGC